MIYLDYAATAPLDPRVLEAMLPHLHDTWGNPSSPHAKGREARAAVDRSRQIIADLIGVLSHEVIFTSSGSEGNSLALFGSAEKWMEKHGTPGQIITLMIEHECTLQAVNHLRDKGWKITLLPVDKHGMLDPENLKDALTDETALISIQWANNEVGTIQPIEQVAQISQEVGVPFHCDAVQPIGQLPFPSPLPDMMTLAAHKFGGPKGISVLIVRDGIELQPLIMGGDQEFGLRAGTENTPGIVGMAKALELSMENIEKTSRQLTELRDFFIGEVLKLEGTSLNGHPEKRLPNNANFRFEGHSGETLVIKLDMEGICASTGSACTTGSTEPSHVLKAMGRSEKEAGENVRFSIGKRNTKDEVKTVISKLKGLVGATKIT